jgi:hypothetical protein
MKDNTSQSGITLFAIPKAFQGHNKVIQINAIRSWLCLRPQCEIILFGNDEGTAEIAAELGVTHIPDIERNEHGTPLVSALFSRAQKTARYDTLCYVNSDIILLSDFLPAISRVTKKPFLIAGQRWDIDIQELLNFTSPDWETQLRTLVKNQGKLHPKTGIDYFVFPRGLYENMPPFAIGRGLWDNWLLYRARALKAPLIDASEVIMAVHQDHDYSHHPGGADGVWRGPEMKRNTELAGGIEHAFSLEYATRLLTLQGLKRPLKPRDMYFRLRAVSILNPNLSFLLKPLDLLLKIRQKSGKP